MGGDIKAEDAVAERNEDVLRRIAKRPMELSVEEYFSISRHLENFHAVFYQFWELGKPYFTESIPTAAVQFDRQGDCINFLFNPKFWKRLTPTQRLFVISHECLHVILDHGSRIKDAQDAHRCNISLDVVVNHLLVGSFGFNQVDVDPQKKYCWIDTVFKNQSGILPGQNFEYYFNKCPATPEVELVDIHSMLGPDEVGEVMRRLGRSLSRDERESLEKILGGHFKDGNGNEGPRGSEAGNLWKTMDLDPIPKKRKWETVIKHWTQKRLRKGIDYFEHWARINRRIVMLPPEIILPFEMEGYEKPDKGRIHLYFFLDTSGSCASLADRFWKAAKSVPDDRFEKHLFCFDTRTYSVDIKKGKLFGFGGTSFDIIENRIQQEMKNNKIPYPEAVFVITDGYGNKVNPAKPERWHWFLSTGYKNLIPKESKCHYLRDFE